MCAGVLRRRDRFSDSAGRARSCLFCSVRLQARDWDKRRLVYADKIIERLGVDQDATPSRAAAAYWRRSRQERRRTADLPHLLGRRYERGPFDKPVLVHGDDAPRPRVLSERLAARGAGRAVFL